MLNNKQSLLPSGVLTWVKPVGLIQAIGGCLRVAAEPFSGADHISDTTGLLCGHGGAGTISIPLSSVKQNYRLISGSGIRAGGSYVAGDTSVGWRIIGLPKDLVLLSKSPDNLNALLVGSDFTFDGHGYVFYKNPISVGSISVVAGEPTVSFFYMSNSTDKCDYASIGRLDRNFGTMDNNKAANKILGEWLATQGACSWLDGAAAGSFCCSHEGELERVWIEGDYKIGVVNNEFLYAPKNVKIKNMGDILKAGESLVHETQNTGTVVISDGVGSWFNAPDDMEGATRTRSTQVLPIAQKYISFQSFVDKFRTNTASDSLVQYIDVASDVGCLFGGADTKISKIWLLYSKESGAHMIPPLYTGLTPSRLKAHCKQVGGCLVCSNLQSGFTEDGDQITVGVSLNSAIFGRRPEAGDFVYGIALEAEDSDMIHKVISVRDYNLLTAQSTVVVRVLGTTAEDKVPSGSTVDNLTIYWLKTVQEFLGD